MPLFPGLELVATAEVAARGRRVAVLDRVAVAVAPRLRRVDDLVATRTDVQLVSVDEGEDRGASVYEPGGERGVVLASAGLVFASFQVADPEPFLFLLGLLVVVGVVSARGRCAPLPLVSRRSRRCFTGLRCGEESRKSPLHP